MLTNCL